MTAATFILLHKNQPNADKAHKMLDFFDWSYEKGDKLATDLGYIPIPESVVKLVEGTWKTSLTSSGKAIY